MNEREQAIHDHIQQDAFANHLGAKVEIVAPGHSRVTLTVTQNLLNFHGTTHGGIVFGVGDIAFAAAGNSRGQTAVALNMTISFLRATQAGDTLIAEAQEQALNGPIGTYHITIIEQNSGELVAQIQAMIYRKREWFVPQATA
ncbi:MAG: hotdog fold thioesterase [Ardenticatenaceae bacterium]|nr:hotdog fold thioesterase [Ardenticatenaceae bacterium]